MDKVIADFLDSWQTDPNGAKDAFLAFQDQLATSGVSFSFKARPNVSYSLRARHKAQTNRELFVLIDVIDDEPESRWLSVCFYADMVTDPDDLADFVPGGLLGEDARCFNLEEKDPSMQSYISGRLAEALSNARG
ncbi:MAG: hypothetical protein K5657_01880 [Desulfovibrio sp.]|nr:hypothetical protein [Desulfovibrio sp.]